MLLYSALSIKSGQINSDTFDTLTNHLIEAYNNGSKDIAVKNMESLLLLCDGTKFEYEPGKAYVSGNSKKLVLNDLVLSKATSYHEFGHLIHNVLSSQYLPSNFNSILERAKLSCKNNVFKLEEMQRE